VAVSQPPRVVSRIARLSLTTAAPGATAAFFRSALGFVERGVEERAGEDFARLMGLPGDAPAQVRLLCLGRQEVELVAFAEKGRPYPPGSTSRDPWFQHMAIVVADMRAAYARLAAQPGWTPISTAGPQRLPDSSGGVTAFKFRDPEGHPLELLEFPPHRTPAVWREPRGGDPYLGIDHSAIVVADTATSVAFYGALGFRVSGSSLNRGAEQERLDGLPGAEVEVTGLEAGVGDVPHLELLRYRAPPNGRFARTEAHGNDVAATRLVLAAQPAARPERPIAGPDALSSPERFAPAASGRCTAPLRDPDGHRLILVG
jgi:catechol 2,3-dioxygenase-like lactoylglutathione lyase family enzyme